MKQKLTLTLLAAILLLSGQQAYAEVYSGEDGNISWSLDTETGVLTLSGSGIMNDYIRDRPWDSYKSYIKNVTILKGVTNIGMYAFRDCSSLTSVTIPEGVTSIKDGAFSGCSSLTSVTIPEGVTSIGSYAFSDCRSLTSVTIPAGVTSIGNYAFLGCRSLTSVTIPAGVTSIGNYAFNGCTGLTSVTIPAGVTSIGNYAFNGCTGLTSVTIPEGVTSIGICAFSGCSSLASVTIPSSVTSIKDGAFFNTLWYHNQENGLLYLDGWLLDYKGSIPGTLIIKDGTKGIANGAFKSCTGLMSVTIPEGVTSIGDYAFQSCTSLTSVTIPDGVTSIGSSAFYGCTGLTSVTIPDGVTSISACAFYGCTGLTSVTIPEGVTSIESSAFYGCTGLTSVTIPEGVTSIGYHAFYGCSSLTSITIPSSVRKIDNSVFGHCDNLTNVTIAEGATSICDNAFMGLRALTNVTIPSSVTSIGNSAFSDCTGLTSVTIPESVTSISDGAFFGCTGLTSVTIPENVTSIGRAAFQFSGLTNITIPSSVTSIGNLAFTFTTWHKSQEDGPLYIDDWFLGYKGTFPVGTLIISDGTKGIADYALCKTSGIIYEDEGDFSGLTNIVIPSSVTSIGGGAFSGCTGLTSVTIPESVTSIGYYAFNGCSSLTSATMESDVPCALGDEPFKVSIEGFKIYVPYGSGDTYKSAAGWSEYADYIVEMPLADYLYMEDSKTFHKSQLTIPVLMKNAKPFTAFQCDITLPEGLTLHKTMNEDDEEVFDIAYGSRAKSSHSLMANQLTNGNIRVAGYSSSNADYRDSEGMFFTLTVDVADDASGDLPIKLSNVILTSATDGDTECPDMEAVLTIIPGQPGDVNGDGKLTMGDVVKLVNNILEVSQTGFNADLADVNEDGKVTMGDVVIVLNMILSGEYPTKAPSMRQPMAKDEVEHDTVL